jgi:hypothetical protein
MGAWIDSLRRDGHFASGTRLRDNAGLVATTAGIVDARQAALPAELLTGFVVLAADDAAQAASIAATCPIVRWGGRLVVREIP